MAELYAPFVRTEQPILFMDIRSAELTKYAANAMLATRISFMNEMAALCERVGADVDQVRKGMGADRRIGYPFLFPGVGYGGSCFPKDMKALVATAREHGLDFDLLRAVERINERQKRLLVEKARKHFGDARRQAPSRSGASPSSRRPTTCARRRRSAIIEGLLGKGARVAAHDPVAAAGGGPALRDRGASCVESPTTAAEGADALFLVTEWNEFRQPDFDRMKQLMKQPVVFDGRNVWDARKAREAGFTYYGVGRSGSGD